MKPTKTLKQYMRVLRIARKPGKDEFVTSSKISALGIAVIGLVGFVIFMSYILFEVYVLGG